MSNYVEVRGVKIGEGVPKICVPIVGKTKEEILSVLCVSDGSYRTMRSRARKRLGIVDKELEAFLLEID